MKSKRQIWWETFLRKCTIFFGRLYLKQTVGERDIKKVELCGGCNRHYVNYERQFKLTFPGRCPYCNSGFVQFRNKKHDYNVIKD